MAEDNRFLNGVLLLQPTRITWDIFFKMAFVSSHIWVTCGCPGFKYGIRIMPEDGRTDWQRVSLQDPSKGKEGPSEENIYVEVLVRGGREEVGVLDSIPFERITTLLAQIAHSMGDALEKANPSKASAELGLEFGLEEGNTSEFCWV